MILAANFCENTVKGWKIVGTLVYIVKILVPIIIIITGTIPFINAITKGTSEELFASAKKLFFKIIAGLIVFITPGLITSLIDMLNDKKATVDVSVCTSCVNDPFGNECNNAEAKYQESREKEKQEVEDENTAVEGNLNTDDLNDINKDNSSDDNNTSNNNGNNNSSNGNNNGNSNSDGSNNNAGNITNNIPSGTNNIIIGDSRTVGICATKTGDWTNCQFSKSGGKVTGSDLYISQGSMSYSWFNSTAVPATISIISKNSNTKYNIFSLMGVNNLYEADKYIKTYNNLANSTWKNQKIIVVAVTPVNESVESSHGYSVKNSSIESFNNKIKSGINTNSIAYCDAYTPLKSGFGTPDGLHYDTNTYNKIYSIIMGCK